MWYTHCLLLQSTLGLKSGSINVHSQSLSKQNGHPRAGLTSTTWNNWDLFFSKLRRMLFTKHIIFSRIPLCYRTQSSSLRVVANGGDGELRPRKKLQRPSRTTSMPTQRTG